MPDPDHLRLPPDRERSSLGGRVATCPRCGGQVRNNKPKGRIECKLPACGWSISCKGQLESVPHSDSGSKVGQAWSRWTEDGFKNFKCPICGDPVRYCKVRGNRSPLIECSNDRCTWTINELIPQRQILLDEKQKPKGTSSRQWNQSSNKAGV